jgi:hypothetical protein
MGERSRSIICSRSSSNLLELPLTVEPRAAKSSVRSSLGIDEACLLVYSPGQIKNILHNVNALPPHVEVEIWRVSMETGCQCLHSTCLALM